MDEHLCAWILEFIIQQPETESLTENLLRTLPLPEDNPHLQKLVLLRSIRKQVADNSISDKTLEALEVIEQIYRGQGIGITESMKKAYCSVALDCTVQACDKLWRTKSRCLKKSMVRQLVCEIFGMRREEDVGPLVWDPVKTRNCALTALTEYLDDAYVAPSFLETAANDESLVKELEMEEDGPREEEQALPMTFSETQNPANSADPRSNANESIRSTEAQMAKEPIIISGDLENVNESASFMDTAEGHETFSETQNPVNTTAPHSNANEPISSTETQMAKEPINISGDLENVNEPASFMDTAEGHETFSETQNPVNSTAPHSNANEPIRSTEDEMAKEPSIISGDFENVNEPASFMDNHELTDPEDSPKAEEKCIYELRPRKRPFHVSETKENVMEPRCCPNYSLHSSEVCKVREALKVSFQELKAVVTDPLPEALRVSEAVASELATKVASNKHIRELDKGVPAQSLATENEASQYEGQDQVNQHRQNSEHSVEYVNANGENHQTQEDDPGKKACSVLSIVSRPSLMERNVTARTFEWEDPVSSCSEGSSRSRIRLSTPKRMPKSPLRKENLKQLGRRRRKRWSLEEEDALRNGVYAHGTGNWELILKSNPGAFEERTGGDLKDKWRNMAGR